MDQGRWGRPPRVKTVAAVDGIDRIMARLAYRSLGPGRVRRRAAQTVLKLVGIDIPRTVTIGPGLKLPHSTTGFVIHGNTAIGERVTIFHGVTIGRSTIWDPLAEGVAWCRGVVEDDVVLCAGAAVLLRDGETITVGRGTVVGANAVLTQSTGEWEIWAGAPARMVGKRTPPLSLRSA